MHKRLIEIVKTQSLDTATLDNIGDLLTTFSNILNDHEREITDRSPKGFS